MVGFGAALASAGSLALGFKASSDYTDARRTQRSRVERTLKHGRSLYGIRADQALDNYLQAIGRIETGTRNALADISFQGQTGLEDLQAGLSQQLAAGRSAVSGSLAASSIFGESQRGAHSDYRRDVGALREALARQRAGVQMQGAQSAASAQQALAAALFRRGAAEFDMQQALAGRFGGVAAPQGADLSEFAGLFDKIPGLFGGFGGSGATGVGGGNPVHPFF